MSEGLGLGSAGFVERHGLYSDEQDGGGGRGREDQPHRRPARRPAPRREHRRGPRRHLAGGRAAADRHQRPLRRREGALLPQSLGEAVEALAASNVYRAAFGDALVDYIVMMKRAEVAVHAQAKDASSWEMAEYFEMF